MVYIIVVLRCIILTVNSVDHLFIFKCVIGIFFLVNSVYIFCPFSELDCYQSLNTELFFICRQKSFNRFIIYKYFFQGVNCPFVLTVSFKEQKFSVFMKLTLSMCLIMDGIFGIVSKKPNICLI